MPIAKSIRLVNFVYFDLILIVPDQTLSMPLSWILDIPWKYALYFVSLISFININMHLVVNLIPTIKRFGIYWIYIFLIFRPEDDMEAWYPPGHGDFYQAFANSGLLDEFVLQVEINMFNSCF